jgi:FkbM family methyltransferase
MSLFSNLRALMRRSLLARGVTVCPYPLKKYLADFQIDCVLDVGANIGQFAEDIRGIGYRGRIESFEPMSTAFKLLHERARKDEKWRVHNFALGEVDGTLELSISANGPSSSFLPLSEDAQKAEVDLAYVAREQVKVKRLDDLFFDIRGQSKHFFLKIDTQGFEKNVIDGASRCLDQISGVQAELSLTRQYEGELLASEFLNMMSSLDFIPYWFVHGYRSKSTMQLKQIDVLFFKNKF